jgi:hypothetical protein
MNGAELIEAHGLLLQSARGAVANIPELVVGSPVRGSWWGHPQHDEIFRVLNEAMIPGQVVRMRLVEGKITLVHRRLWPALVRLAGELGPDRLDVIHEEHTDAGAHRKVVRPFPDWVPAPVIRAAETMTEATARAMLPDHLW